MREARVTLQTHSAARSRGSGVPSIDRGVTSWSSAGWEAAGTGERGTGGGASFPERPLRGAAQGGCGKVSRQCLAIVTQRLLPNMPCRRLPPRLLLKN
ncbi:hypothetical protein NDU88_010759 [Pleurodeles waltl]|uniref:Uncharacterized protein n=1 Tax=Pleurodeles waltl TaxID=8319 RepID=A0AAV7S0J8_PLEWA|nr:hypothetical protein NDU88_010759 [Pleurodeles waltl]